MVEELEDRRLLAPVITAVSVDDMSFSPDGYKVSLDASGNMSISTVHIWGSGFDPNSTVAIGTTVGLKPTLHLPTTSPGPAPFTTELDVANPGALVFGVNTIIVSNPNEAATYLLKITGDPEITSGTTAPTPPNAGPPVIGQAFFVTLHGRFNSQTVVSDPEDFQSGYVIRSIVPQSNDGQTLTFKYTAKLAGSHPFTVHDLGGGRGSFDVTVYNPDPVLSAVEAALTPDGSSFVFTLKGANFLQDTNYLPGLFNNGSEVFWRDPQGNNRGVPYVFMDSGTLKTTVPLSALLDGNNVLFPQIHFYVVNPDPTVIGFSDPKPVTLKGPKPQVTAISPAGVSAGSSGATLTIDGSGFKGAAKVLWNGVPLSTQLAVAAAGMLSIPIPAALLAGAGSASVAVVGSDGQTSNSATFTIGNSTLTGMTPDHSDIVDGSASALPITVFGTSFLKTSQIFWNGTALPTTPPLQDGVSAISGSIPASLLTTAGTATVTVVTPGQPTAGPLTFTIYNPKPSVTVVSLPQVLTGADNTITVPGKNFVTGAKVLVDGTPCTTTVLDATHLTVTIPGSLLPPAHVYVDGILHSNPPPKIVVANQEPSDGPSDPVNMALFTPAPTISTLSPDTIPVGSGNVQVIVDGSGFLSGRTQVFVGNVPQFENPGLAVTVLSDTRLVAIVPQGYFYTGIITSLTAVNFPISVGHDPYGGSSSPATFTVTNPAPTVTGQDKAFVPAGTATPVTLKLTGTGFGPWTSVAWSGDANTAAYVYTYTSTQLVVNIGASGSAPGLSVPGNATIKVMNASPGGGNALVNFVIANPLPTIASIFPDSAVGQLGYDNFSWFGGSTDMNFLVNGTGFLQGATVRWNGQDRATTYVSSTQLRVTFTTTDFVSFGTAQVTIHNADTQDSLPHDYRILPTYAKISAVTPSSATPGSGSLTITLTGSFFVATSEVRWNNDTKLPTTYVSGQKLTATIGAQLLSEAGVADIRVYTPDPQYNTPVYLPSDPFSFRVQIVPSMTSLNPSTIPAGSGDFTLTVTGTNFRTGDAVEFAGGQYPILLDSSSQFHIVVPGSLIASPGQINIRVDDFHDLNPAYSNTLPFTIGPALAPTSAGPSGTAATAAPRFVWPTTAGVGSYEVYVQDLSGGGAQDVTVTTNGWTPPAPLLAGHRYRWWYKPDVADWSDAIEFGVPQPAMLGPVGTSNSAAPPTFTWNGVTGVPQYEIYVDDLTSGFWADQTVTGTSWISTKALLPGHTYRWWLRALNTDGSGGLWSDSSDFSVPSPSLQGPAGAANTAAPALTWNGVTGAAGYEVYVQDLNTGQALDQNVTVASFTPNPPLKSGHSYRWWVRGLDNAGGGGTWTDSLDFSVPMPILTSPSGQAGNAAPQFSWNSVAGVTQYEVYVTDLTVGGAVDQTVTGTSWTPSTPLPSGHRFRWWLRGADGAWTDSLDFTVGLPGLVGPSGPVTTAKPALTWTGVAGVAQYEIYVQDLVSGQAIDENVSGTTWTPALPLAAGHSYRWWVRGLDGAWTDSLDFTVGMPVPTAPSGQVSTVTPTLSWSGVTGVAQYEIFVQDLTNGSWVDENVSGTTWAPSTMLESGHSYRWWIRSQGGLWSDSLDFTIDLPVPVAPAATVATPITVFTWRGRRACRATRFT